MSQITLESAPEWYRVNAPVYQGLCEVLSTTISSLLHSKSIDFLAVNSRVKTLASLTEKLDRKNYHETENLTDICGLRIITYIESDVEKICKLIEDCFEIHIDKSVDKSKQLQADQIGYRSVHYICELGKDRIVLPELRQYEKLLFEVQIRTVLQHAWAEIEHDRSYKFAGELPSAIKRRLNLLAGTLELVDREFNTLAREVEEHEERTKSAVKTHKLDDIELTSTGLSVLLLNIPELRSMPGFNVGPDPVPVSVFQELKDYGINTLADCAKLLSKKFLESYIKHYKEWNSAHSLVRCAMLFEDLEKYLTITAREEERTASYNLCAILDERYGTEKVNEEFKKFRIKRDTAPAKPASRRKPPPPERPVRASQAKRKS